MRLLLRLLPFLLLCEQVAAAPINLVQVQLSHYGGINADKDPFPYNGDDSRFNKYDMSFERSYAVRAVYSVVYLSVQRSLTDLNTDIPEAKVETAAVGFALANDGEKGGNLDTYFVGAIGLGAGQFTFKKPDLNDWEAMLEVNLEGGIKIAKHFLLGAGVTYQHFGAIKETKAELGSIYISTGICF